MDLLARLSVFTIHDAIALAVLLVCWIAIGLMIERKSATRPSTSCLMQRYRHEWMKVCVARDPRILDGSILATLRQGTSFFASGTMIAVGGALALLGNTEPLRDVAQDLTLESAPAVVWEVKILCVVLFLANAFLKFVWAHRLFGYAAVLMAAIPNDPDDPLAAPRGKLAADVNNSAARSFNRGLRSVYFALAALAWLLGALALIGVSIVTFWVLYRREFASNSRQFLLDGLAAEDRPGT